MHRGASNKRPHTIRDWPLSIQYALSIGAVGAALLLRLFLDPVLGDRLPYVTVFLVLLPLVLLVRPGPFLAGALLGCAGAVFFFLPPRLTLRLEGPLAALQAGLFLLAVLTAAVTAWLAQRADRRARSADVMLRAFVDESPTCKWVTDPKGRIVYVNRAMAEALGRPPDQIIGRTHAQVLPPRLAELATRHIQSVRESQRPCISFEEIEPLDGTGARRVLEWRRFALKVADDDHVLVAGMANDITEKTRIERALRDSEAALRAKAEELQTIFDIAPVQIWVGDANCTAFYGNRSAYQEHGLAPGTNASFDAPIRELPEGLRLEADGRTLLPHEMPMQLAARTGKPVEHFEHDVVHPDGRRQTMWANVSPLFNPDGTVRGVVGVYVDITQRKRLEQSLRDSEARLKSILEQLPVAVGVMDMSGTWTLTNSLMDTYVPHAIPSNLPDRITRWRAWDQDGNPIPPENWPGRRALRGERVIPGLEMLHTADDGREIWMRISAAPLLDESGRIAGATAVVQDIDLSRRFRDRLEEELARRTAEVQQAALSLARAQRLAAVGTMASGLAHDITNITLPLGMHLDGILANPNLDKETKAELVVITALIDHLRLMSRNLSLFSRDPEQEGTEGSTELASWCARVQGLVDASLATRHAGRAGRYVRLKCDVPAGLPPVKVAPHRLTQAVLNLVHNARDAILEAYEQSGQPFDGCIIIEARAQADGAAVTLKVIDNGTGMPPDVASRAVEPFFTTKQRPAAAGASGSGMGLSLAHGICERVGGRLDIESTVGKGTTITMTLPAVAGVGAAPVPETKPHLHGPFKATERPTSVDLAHE